MTLSLRHLLFIKHPTSQQILKDDSYKHPKKSMPVQYLGHDRKQVKVCSIYSIAVFIKPLDSWSTLLREDISSKTKENHKIKYNSTRKFDNVKVVV